MKVVVTGASGFLGQAVTRRLRGLRVQVDAVSRQALPDAIRVKDYAEAPGGDVLVHLAQSSDRSSVNAADVLAENEASRTLRALLAKGFERVVYASSAVLYGHREASPHRPTDAVHVADSYGRIKRESEIAVLSSGRGTVARLANLYGPGMSRGNVVSTILRQIPGRGPLEVADCAPVRDFLWFDDAAAGISAMVIGNRFGVFNLGTGVGTSIGELARQALDLAGETERPVVATNPAKAFSTLVLDVSVGFVPDPWRSDTPLREGLARLLDLRSQPSHE